MGTTIPLRIDSALVNQARSAGSLFDRPATAQIEHWAKLGRVIDAILSGGSAAKLKGIAKVVDIDRIVAYSQTKEGREKALKLIKRQGGPIYGADPDSPGLLIEQLPDGRKRRGHFLNREFVPVGDSPR